MRWMNVSRQAQHRNLSVLYRVSHRAALRRDQSGPTCGVPIGEFSMLPRRQILKSGAAAAALTAFAAPLARAATGSGGADLNKLFDQFMKENLDISPTGATFRGVDVGDRAKERGEVDDNSLAGYAKQKALTADQLKRLNAFDAKSLSGMDALNYEIIQYGLNQQSTADQRCQYGGTGAGAPYIVS